MSNSLAHPRTSLRREIMRLIQPYAYAEKDDIPFTTPELIVMAIAGSFEVGLKKRNILSWIREHFKAYRMIASSVFILGDHRNQVLYDKILTKFNDSFDLYEMPLLDAVSTFPAVSRQNGIYAVETRAARIYLHRHLDLCRAVAPSIGLLLGHLGRRLAEKLRISRPHVDFLGLPPEIRIMIYEYIFSYPFLGIIRREDSRELSWLYTDQREHDRPFLKSAFKWWLPIAPARDMLALTTVNRQIHREAFPTFFKNTVFELTDPVTLHSLVTKVPTDTLASLSDLRIISNFTSEDEAKSLQRCSGTVDLAREDSSILDGCRASER